LEEELERQIFHGKMAWRMEQALADMNAKGAVEQFQSALGMSLKHEKFGGTPKKYTPDEWTTLLVHASKEGPPTQNMVRLGHELQRLQVCLGDLTLDQANSMNGVDTSQPYVDHSAAAVPAKHQSAAKSSTHRLSKDSTFQDLEARPECGERGPVAMDTSSHDQFPGLVTNSTETTQDTSTVKTPEPLKWNPCVTVKYTSNNTSTRRTRRRKKKKKK